MIVGSYRTTTTPSSGTATGTTQELKGMLQGITVSSTTSTTTFNFKIADSAGDLVFIETGITNNLVDNTPIALPYDRYTWTISLASADEAFVVKLRVLEMDR